MAPVHGNAQMIVVVLKDVFRIQSLGHRLKLYPVFVVSRIKLRLVVLRVEELVDVVIVKDVEEFTV
jgi:hypothetical protein